MEIPPGGVRKGRWSKEEDDLLRACIQRYGEGKWRLVPQRAGLNRCRKSCRLRWMNYLKPDIKRGNFTEDEADMIMRFRRLLGNRWSLIAARFPGRTSNDVKNYWNTHILKRLQCSSSSSQEATLKTQKLIKPRPLSFPRKRKGLLLADKSDCRDKPVIATDSDSGDVAVAVSADSSAKESEKEKEWWQSLLDDVIVNKGSNEEGSLWRLGGEKHQDKFLQPQFWDEHDDQQQFHFFQ